MPIEVNEKGELIGPAIYSSLRSEAMNEIISRKPGFLERWALFFFLFVLLSLIAATWFVHYPDVFKTRATLIATNAPKEIIIRQDGRLIKLFATNNDIVSAGTIIGFIESNAKHEEVLLLRNYLDTAIADLQKNNTQNIESMFATTFDALGELQQGYQQFMISYQQFTDYLNNGFYLRKKKILGEDLTYLQKNHGIQQQQKELMLKDLNLSEESYKANESLLKDRVISKQDDRNEQSKLLNKQMSIPQVNSILLNNEIQQREKQKEINELEHSISMQKSIFQQAAQTFLNQVMDWYNKYVLQASISGKITYLTSTQENQFLKAGKILGFINPPNTRYYAEVNLHQYDFGKLDTGQQVQLRFDAYPYEEFGYVKGRLNFITEFATDSGFLAHIQIENGLATNQHKKLQYRDGLKAEALIITKDMRLMERFYQNLTSVIKR
ncbi:HlyD family secretion protein [Hydrobacter penzbergensis]|uniref:HlyD family secretion protein n=1 Tax=Hydrobacter penzbergensis TaxID=1235997 RepID=A0A8X8IGY7_9BACT|nr:HlyD family efflux transporter periplasmic adaptor subunit [Hydrobacter penzbergensis]SDX27102.1 HlyD family secretion protein [Hydrobacter penzbergensis]